MAATVASAYPASNTMPASPEWRAASVQTAIELSQKRDVVSAGFVETQATVQAIANWLLANAGAGAGADAGGRGAGADAPHCGIPGVQNCSARASR